MQTRPAFQPGVSIVVLCLDKTSKADYLAPSDKCADLLHKIYGVSTKGVKNELELQYKKEKKPKLASRHLTEVNKSFEEAYNVLEVMQFKEGKRIFEEEQQGQERAEYGSFIKRTLEGIEC